MKLENFGARLQQVEEALQRGPGHLLLLGEVEKVGSRLVMGMTKMFLETKTKIIFCV